MAMSKEASRGKIERELDRQAARLGVTNSDSIRVFEVEGDKVAHIIFKEELASSFRKEYPEVEGVILIPKLQEDFSLGSLRRSLRHELSHYRLHSSKPSSLYEEAVMDLEAQRMAEGRVSGYEIGNLILRLELDRGLSRNKSIELVRRAAKFLGVSGRVFSNGLELLKLYDGKSSLGGR